MAWWYFVLAFVWVLLMRGHWKRRAARTNATISAGSVRDMGGRGGF